MGSSSNNRDLVRRAMVLLEETTRLVEHLDSAGHGRLGFDAGASEAPDTDEFKALQAPLLASLDELQRLVSGPRHMLRRLCCTGNDLAALQVAFELGFYDAVPEPPPQVEGGGDGEDGDGDGTISAQDLAARVGMDADRAARVVRMLATHGVFREGPRPGRFGHSAASLLMKRDEPLRCAGRYMLDEMWQAASSLADSVRAAPFESDARHSAFRHRHGLPLFEYYAQNKELAARFAKAMAGATSVDRQISELADGFDWAQIKGRVIDVGGGSGHVSMALAHRFPHINFLVQDGSADMLAQGKQLLSGPQHSSLAGRISFQQHSFFDAQPGADNQDVGAYFIRQCTHNWCDRDVITILRAFVTGLEGCAPEVPLLINDTIVPEPGVLPAHQERDMRQFDMLMMIALGAKQRTLAEFEALLAAADRRYVLDEVHTAKDGSMGLLKVLLKRD